MAEWVRSLDWRPGGPGFESSCGNFALDLWQFHLPRFANVFRETLNVAGPFYLMSMPGEIKRSHQSALEMCNLSWTPNCSLVNANYVNHSHVSPNMGCLEYT